MITIYSNSLEQSRFPLLFAPRTRTVNTHTHTHQSHSNTELQTWNTSNEILFHTKLVKLFHTVFHISLCACIFHWNTDICTCIQCVVVTKTFSMLIYWNNHHHPYNVPFMKPPLNSSKTAIFNTLMYSLWWHIHTDVELLCTWRLLLAVNKFQYTFIYLYCFNSINLPLCYFHDIKSNNSESRVCSILYYILRVKVMTADILKNCSIERI